MKIIYLPILACLIGVAQAAAQTPAGLSAALAAAQTQYPALAAKRAELQAKGYLVDAAQAQRYPSLSAQTATYDNSTRPSSWRARQALWAFGRIESGQRYAEADQSAAAADLLRLERQVQDQTAVAYAKVQGAKARLKVAQDTEAALDRLYQQIQRRERGELASMADVRLALARFTQARAQTYRYQGEWALSKTELLALTQNLVDTEPDVPATTTTLPQGTALQDEVAAQAADLLLKTRLAVLAQMDIEREKAAAMPTVYLQADRYINQPTYGTQTITGVVLEGNLDNMGFGTLGRSRAAGARLQAAQDDLQATRIELIRQVSSLETNRDLQVQLLSAQAQSVQQAKDLLASYQRQYEAGSKAWLDVLNMQRELSDQQLQQVQAQNDWLVYSLKLAALTGRLDALAQGKD